MKYIFVSIAFTMLFSCSSRFVKLSNGKKIDKRLVGTWIGTEIDQQFKNEEKKWEMKRLIDGTFILYFQYTKNGVLNSFTETGLWWIENGIFHEFHKESGLTDQYKYEVLNSTQIKFISHKMSVEMNTDVYEFIDTRK